MEYLDSFKANLIDDLETARKRFRTLLLQTNNVMNEVDSLLYEVIKVLRTH